MDGRLYFNIEKAPEKIWQEELIRKIEHKEFSKNHLHAYTELANKKTIWTERRAKT